MSVACAAVFALFPESCVRGFRVKWTLQRRVVAKAGFLGGRAICVNPNKSFAYGNVLSTDYPGLFIVDRRWPEGCSIFLLPRPK